MILLKKFQFQYGAIQRSDDKIQPKLPTEFQFQYGAIQRQICIMLFFMLHCFNSNMVRFRVYAEQHAASVTRFQFQYGAIQRLNAEQHAGSVNRFQFQYGAIQRKLLNGTRPASTGFNSNMVRFRDYMLNGTRTALTGFNSNMVRFRVHYFVVFAFRSRVSIPIWCDLEKKKLQPETLIIPFQFQYGAIQSSLD